MYANIGNPTMDDKTIKKAQQKEGNEKTENNYSENPRDLINKDKLDKDKVSGIKRMTSAAEQVVNTTHPKLAEHSNTSSAAAAVAEDTGRWTNQDGLIYTSIKHDCNLGTKRPSPRLQRTEYAEVTFNNGKTHVCD